MGELSQPHDSRYQTFPSAGPLRANMNLDRGSLAQRLDGIHAQAYCYIVATVKRQNGQLIQTGSGPNFQSGCLTLCTCKWRMRAAKEHADDWKGTWVAGLTGAHVGGPDGNYLFYLTRVAQPFASHRDLWRWFSDHAAATNEAKAADKNRLGDLYRPSDRSGDPFDPRSYFPPRRNHPHWRNDQWRKDINDQSFGRRPSLLVGAPEDTYVWSEPLIRAPFHVGRGYRIVDLSALLG